MAGENIGEFDKLIANCQGFLPLIYGIFNIRILVSYLPQFSTPNNLNSLVCQCFLPSTFSAMWYVATVHKIYSMLSNCNLLNFHNPYASYCMTVDDIILGAN